MVMQNLFHVSLMLNQRLGGLQYLVSSDNRTANLAGSNLRHVENDNGRDEANAKTSNQTARNEQSK